jgi:hypothetical protein
VGNQSSFGGFDPGVEFFEKRILGAGGGHIEPTLLAQLLHHDLTKLCIIFCRTDLR